METDEIPHDQCKCGNMGAYLDKCPYAEELAGIIELPTKKEDSLCFCCDQCRHLCAMKI